MQKRSSASLKSGKTKFIIIKGREQSVEKSEKKNTIVYGFSYLFATVSAICDMAVTIDETREIIAGILSELNLGRTTSIAPKNAIQMLRIFAFVGFFR